MPIGFPSAGTRSKPTRGQTLALQQDALNEAGCEELYTDTVSGSVTDRPGLAQALSHLRIGDTLVVWRLDSSRALDAADGRLAAVSGQRENISPVAGGKGASGVAPRHSAASSGLSRDEAACIMRIAG